MTFVFFEKFEFERLIQLQHYLTPPFFLLKKRENGILCWLKDSKICLFSNDRYVSSPLEHTPVLMILRRRL